MVLIAETMDDVPFDLQQYRVLNYDVRDPDWGGILATGITSAITEILKDPGKAVPDAFREKVESQAPDQDILDARFSRMERQIGSLRSTVSNITASAASTFTYSPVSSSPSISPSGFLTPFMGNEGKKLKLTRAQYDEVMEAIKVIKLEDIETERTDIGNLFARTIIKRK